MSRAKRLDHILKTLQNESPEIEACALVSEDSLVITSALPQHMDELRVAGICATLLNLGTRASTVLQRGDVQQVLVQGTDGYIVMMTGARSTMLIALTSKNAKLGLVFLDMHSTIDELRKVL